METREKLGLRFNHEWFNQSEYRCKGYPQLFLEMTVWTPNMVSIRTIRRVKHPVIGQYGLLYIPNWDNAAGYMLGEFY